MEAPRKLDKLFSSARLWREEADRLREVLRACGLTEELKWRSPCYTAGGKNICVIQRMKDFLALLFFKGALLKDQDGILEPQGPNSREGYRVRFTGVDDVARLADSVKACVREAIAVEQAGLRVEAAPDLDYPQELIDKLDEDPDLGAAFDALTPGRRRGYVLHFSAAKQSKTRAARVDRCRDKILAGKGFLER